jgi:hypothetical protein
MLEENNKSGFIFVATSKEFFENSHANKLLKEIDSVIVNYSEVELSPMPKRTYEKGSGKKVDLNVGTIFARVPELNNFNYYTNEKIKFLKKEGVISDFDTCSVADRKAVIVPLADWFELNDLNKKNKNVNNALAVDINNFNLQVEEKEHTLGKSLMVKLLQEYGYRIFVIKNSDIEKVKNDKSIIVGLKKAFNELLKNQDFIAEINKYNEENYISDLGLIKKGTGKYDEIFKNELGKKYFSLSGFEIDKLKIYEKDISTKNTYIPHAIKDDYILIAKYLSKGNGKFDKYLNESHVEKMEEIIKTEYPIIHYMYDKFGAQTYNSYDTREYDTNGKEGLTLLKDDLLKLINEALNKK